MSLINQMLKDLEKRRSRDLETSPSLNQNITWETGPNKKSFNVLSLLIVFILVFLLLTVSYLLWERSFQETVVVAAENYNVVIDNKEKKEKRVIKKEPVKEKVKKVVLQNIEEEKVDTSNSVDVEEIDASPPLKLKKIHRPLNNKQLAEIAYNKGYDYLQQGRMHRGKESLRKALSLYIPHIKAREMLAGIHIKSGRFIDAAELLSEGVKVVPEYPLFAQLYARVLLEQKKPQLAIKILENGSARLNVEPDYYALLAATYQRVNNHQKAVEIYLRLVKVRSDEGVWWLGLGISLEKSGNKKEALEAYQRAQKTGRLKSGLVKFTNNRVSALQEIGFPEN